MNHFNLVYNNSASVVMVSQGGNHKPGIWKNFMERNMILIFCPEGQRVERKEEKSRGDFSLERRLGDRACMGRN